MVVLLIFLISRLWVARIQIIPTTSRSSLKTKEALGLRGTKLHIFLVRKVKSCVPHVHKVYVDLSLVICSQAKGVWAFEFKTRNAGGSIRWNTPLRIRHVPSGRYLAVDVTERGHVTRRGSLGGNTSSTKNKEVWFQAMLVEGFASKSIAESNRPRSEESMFFHLVANEKTSGDLVPRSGM